MDAPDPAAVAPLIQDGLAHHRAGRLPEAEAAYRGALAAQPGHPDALHLLGVIAHQVGRHDAALELIGKAIAASPDNGSYHNDIGEALGAAGRHGDAIRHHLRAIALMPDNAEAHYNLANAYRRSGYLDQAIAAYRRAIELKPGLAEAYNNLGVALLGRGDFAEALAAHQRAMEINPDHPAANNNLGTALHESGRVAEAAVAYRRALEVNPDYPEAQNNLAVALEHLGQLDEAKAGYRRALALKPDYCAAYRHLGYHTTYAADDPDIRAMEKLLGNAALSQADAVQLNFALGKAYDDTGDYGRAFGCFAAANAKARKSIAFDLASQESLFERIRAVFPAPAMESPGGGHDSPVPIFIVGMPRSGTTLVEQIIASHAEVFGAGELKFLGGIAGQLGQQFGGSSDFPECIADIPAASWRDIGDSYLDQTRQLAPGAGFVTDKMPSSFRLVGLIRRMLPRARIINCVRNPAAVCLSCYMTLFTRGQEFSYDLGEAGRYYRLYDAMMEHWRTTQPGAVFDVGYEDVVSDLEGTARKLIDFCGLEWSDACLDFHNSKRPVDTASAAQVRRPIYTTSLEKWRRYRPYLDELFEDLGPLAPK